MSKPSVVTLGTALYVGRVQWRENKTRVCLARSCIDILGGENTPAGPLKQAKYGVALLEGLRIKGLGPASINQAYRTFRQMLALSEIQTLMWPKAPKPPRRTRDRISNDDLDRLIERLASDGDSPTADLARLIKACGLRVDVEGLSEVALRVTLGVEYDTLLVTGKGGHERTIPVVDPIARELLRDAERMARLRGTPYHTHRRRWNAALAALGITGRKLTFHSARHAFASEVYSRTGGNLLLTQELLGHADPKTTARYVHQDTDKLVKGVGG